MKQGPSKTSAGNRKSEPSPRVVNVGKVSRIGVHEVTKDKTTLYGGRGFAAPKPVAQKSHARGSQGKSK